MHLIKRVMLGTTMAFVITTTCFAADVSQRNYDNSIQCHQESKKLEIVFEKDPVKKLEDRKVHIQQKVNEGKITKDKASEINTRIDKRINDIKQISKLPLDQRKAALIAKFKEGTNKRVQEGKLTQDEANKLLTKYTEQINKWDGSGYPMVKHEKHHCDK